MLGVCNINFCMSKKESNLRGGDRIIDGINGSIEVYPQKESARSKDEIMAVFESEFPRNDVMKMIMSALDSKRGARDKERLSKGIYDHIAGIIARDRRLLSVDENNLVLEMNKIIEKNIESAFRGSGNENKIRSKSEQSRIRSVFVKKDTKNSAEKEPKVVPVAAKNLGAAATKVEKSFENKGIENEEEVNESVIELEPLPKAGEKFVEEKISIIENAWNGNTLNLDPEEYLLQIEDLQPLRGYSEKEMADFLKESNEDLLEMYANCINHPKKKDSVMASEENQEFENSEENKDAAPDYFEKEQLDWLRRFSGGSGNLSHERPGETIKIRVANDMEHDAKKTIEEKKPAGQIGVETPAPVEDGTERLKTFEDFMLDIDDLIKEKSILMENDAANDKLAEMEEYLIDDLEIRESLNESILTESARTEVASYAIAANRRLEDHYGLLKSGLDVESDEAEKVEPAKEEENGGKDKEIFLQSMGKIEVLSREEFELSYGKIENHFNKWGDLGKPDFEGDYREKIKYCLEHEHNDKFSAEEQKNYDKIMSTCLNILDDNNDKIVAIVEGNTYVVPRQPEVILEKISEMTLEQEMLFVDFIKETKDDLESEESLKENYPFEYPRKQLVLGMMRAEAFMAVREYYESKASEMLEGGKNNFSEKQRMLIDKLSERKVRKLLKRMAEKIS